MESQCHQDEKRESHNIINFKLWECNKALIEVRRDTKHLLKLLGRNLRRLIDQPGSLCPIPL